MTSWIDGYVAESDYTHGFYCELTPRLLSFAATLSNLASLPLLAKRRYCELGCGQGVSANIIAAENPNTEVHGTGFNPSQIAGVRQFAEEGGLINTHFHEQPSPSFAVEAALPDQFDIIAQHGVQSWISAKTRRPIVEFIRRTLQPDRLASYN